MAPPEVKGRQFDYPFGANLNYIPRAEDGISFAELRGLADALPLLRAVIETRKDQIAGQNYAVRARARADAPDASKSIDAVSRFLARPDRRHSFADWLRMLVEEMLVIDAATIYPRYDRGGALYSLDIIDGATIKPLIGEDGRAPEPPDPAYQQILKGVPAADFSADELIYLPRNLRSHRLYGMSPVEQIALTVNIALRRDAATLDYYRTGSSPDAFATLPKEWTADQIRSFQDYFDALMSGNLARRRMTKFMPADFKLIETRQTPRIPGLRTKHEHFLDRLLRSWHSQLQWENGAGGDRAAAGRSGFPDILPSDAPVARPGAWRACLPEPACPHLISSCRSPRSTSTSASSPASRRPRRPTARARFSTTRRASPISSNGRRTRSPRAAVNRSAPSAQCMRRSPPAS